MGYTPLGFLSFKPTIQPKCSKFYLAEFYTFNSMVITKGLKNATDCAKKGVQVKG